jgi:hypothetical protein
MILVDPGWHLTAHAPLTVRTAVPVAQFRLPDVSAPVDPALVAGSAAQFTNVHHHAS